jgi:hypothetical protein
MAAQADPLLGTYYRLEISTDGGTTYDKVALITDLSVDESIEEREIVHRDNCAEKDYIPSDYSGSGSFTCYVNHAVESGFLKANDIKALFYAKTVFNFKVTPIDCSDNPMADEYEITGATGFLTSCNASYTVSEEAIFDCSWRFKGQPDYAVVV